MLTIGGTEYRGPWSGQGLCQSRVEAEASQVVESRCPAAGEAASRQVVYEKATS
jgi:hypothetical protein